MLDVNGKRTSDPITLVKVKVVLFTETNNSFEVNNPILENLFP